MPSQEYFVVLISPCLSLGSLSDLVLCLYCTLICLGSKQWLNPFSPQIEAVYIKCSCLCLQMGNISQRFPQCHTTSSSGPTDTIKYCKEQQQRFCQPILRMATVCECDTLSLAGDLSLCQGSRPFWQSEQSPGQPAGARVVYVYELTSWSQRGRLFTAP